MQRMQADGPEAVYGIPSSSSSSWTVPSSPPRPCSATNATSGRASPSRSTRSGPTSIATTSWPSRSQRVLHARARAQRDLPLERVAALEDRDLHPALRRSGSTREAGSEDGLGRRPRRGRLGAGQRAVERDLLADDLADPADALADRVVADAREVQPHLRAAAAVEVGRAAGHERDVLAQRARQQVGRVDVVRQPRPDEQAALRPGPGRLAREVLGERLEHDVAPPPVDAGELADVGEPVALGEVGAHEQLRQRRGAEVRGALAEVELVEHGPRRGAPAQAQPGREDLRERAEVDHELAAVERVQRRQRLALVAQHPVRVVLEHEQLAAARDLDQPAAALERHRHPRGVLERRHRVDELRRAARGVEALELGLEQVDVHAVLVHADLHDVGLVGDEHRHRAGIRRALGDHDVARVDQRLADEVDHLLAAGGHEQVVGLDLHATRPPSPR